MGKLSEWAVFLAFGCLTFFHFRGFHASSGENILTGREVRLGEVAESVTGQLGVEWTRSRQHLIFFIDFRDFACLSCLDSFLGFYRGLPPRFQSEDSMGILILDSEKDDETSVQIARVKLRGFVLSNHIAFPVQVDRFHVFREIAREGTSVVLLDYDREIVRKFLFPLRQKDEEELSGYLEME